jgi:hypothetical protein
MDRGTRCGALVPRARARDRSTEIARSACPAGCSPRWFPSPGAGELWRERERAGPRSHVSKRRTAPPCGLRASRRGRSPGRPGRFSQRGADAPPARAPASRACSRASSRKVGGRRVPPLRSRAVSVIVRARSRDARRQISKNRKSTFGARHSSAVTNEGRRCVNRRCVKPLLSSFPCTTRAYVRWRATWGWRTGGGHGGKRGGPCA